MYVQSNAAPQTGTPTLHADHALLALLFIAIVMPCTDKVLDLPFSISPWLGSDTEIARADLRASALAVGLAFDASVTLSLEQGREVHLKAQSRISSVPASFANLPDVVTSVTSLDARMLGERASWAVMRDLVCLLALPIRFGVFFAVVMLNQASAATLVSFLEFFHLRELLILLT